MLRNSQFPGTGVVRFMINCYRKYELSCLGPAHSRFQFNLKHKCTSKTDLRTVTKYLSLFFLRLDLFIGSKDANMKMIDDPRNFNFVEKGIYRTLGKGGLGIR